MDSTRGRIIPGMFSPKAFSPLLAAVTPNPSVLIQYPLFFTMARVTVHAELRQSKSSITASIVHGIDVYNRYGLFALYRGLPVYLAHSLGTTLLRVPTKKIASKRAALAARLTVDACTYPLLVACTRMAAYTTGDSQWGFADCVRSTVNDDGWIGLWAGAAPFLLVSAYKELEELAFEYVKSANPSMEETDAALLGFVRIGLGAVLTSPFLTMSTILRCQSANPDLLPPSSHSEVFLQMPWKWNLIAISLVLALGAINLAIIREKNSIPDEPTRRTVSPSGRPRQ